jgi:hypothetical protein
MTNQKYLVSLLKDPMLLSNCALMAIDSITVGEDSARQVIFLTGIGSLVLNANKTSFNLLVNSRSGAGKDHTVSSVMKIFPEEMVHKRTRITPTVLTYWHDSKSEPDWTWDRKILYLEDVSNSVLNCSVFKVFCSGGSTATIVKDQKAVDIEIKGKPTIIITSASADPEPELVRRFLVINLTETEQQTKKIMEKWADTAATGKVMKMETKYNEAIKLLKSYKVVIPFSRLITKYFPHEHIISRTMYPRFLDYVKASAVLHQYNREKDVDGFLIAEGQDYDIARNVFLATSCNDKMIPLTQTQKQLVQVMKELGACPYIEGDKKFNRGWMLVELVGKVNFLGRTQLYKQLSKLVEYRFMKKGTYKSEYDKRPSVTYAYQEQTKLVLPTWKEIENSLDSHNSVDSQPSPSTSFTDSTDKEISRTSESSESQQTVNEVN